MLREEFCAFAALTNGRGKALVSVSVVHADTEEEIARMPARQVNFGDNPLPVFGLPFRIRNCVFPEPGLYWIRLHVDEAILAQQDLILR